MKRTVWIVGICALLLGIAGSVVAQEQQQTEKQAHTGTCRLCDAAESKAYVTQVAGKFGRGATNALFGWTELIVSPMRASHAHEGLAVGIDRGIGHMLKRTIVGLGELFTCWTWPGTPQWAQDCSWGTMGMAGR